MKLFKTFRKNFALIGITSNVNALDSGKIFLTSLIIWSVGLSSWIFFACEASSFIEYTVSIYIASGTTVTAIYFMIVILQIQNIFKFIDGCKKIIKNGKNRHQYF